MSTSIDMSTLPRLAAWAESQPQFTPMSWLYAETDIETGIAFTALFWPDLVEHDGGVFLQAFFETSIFEQWRARLGDDITAIERVMNHRHVGDLLPGGDRVGFSNLCHLGEVLAATWRARVVSAFPERQFEVRCTVDSKEEEVVVTFCQSPKRRNQ